MSLIDYHFRVLVEDSPDYYYKGIQTDVPDPTVKDPANPGFVHRDYVVEFQADANPSSGASGLAITTDVGSAIVADVTNIVADLNDTKYCLVSVVRDNTSGLLEVQVQEKVLGNYSGTPEDKTWECDINEYSLVANGTVLVQL